MTSNTLIYRQAISALEDPILTKIYSRSNIDFCQKMYTFLQRAIPLFNIPVNVIYDLIDSVEPSLYEISYIGDGEQNSFELKNVYGDLEIIVEAYINGDKVEGNYNSQLETYTFSQSPAQGSQIILKEYQPGYFKKTLDAQETSILSLLTVACWAEKEENFLLDIRRLLNTSNFKLNDSSSVLRSKVNWYYTMYEKASKLMSNYSLVLARRGA